MEFELVNLMVCLLGAVLEKKKEWLMECLKENVSEAVWGMMKEQQ